MKLRGHTDNIRVLLLDSTGRLVEGPSKAYSQGPVISVSPSVKIFMLTNIKHSTLVVTLRLIRVLSLSYISRDLELHVWLHKLTAGNHFVLVKVVG